MPSSVMVYSQLLFGCAEYVLMLVSPSVALSFPFEAKPAVGTNWAAKGQVISMS